MAIQAGVKQAYAMFNGQKIVATYNETTGLWTAEMTAPDLSSWTQQNHVYTVSLHAEDEAGNTVEVTSSDPTYGDQLKIRVMEKTKPVATIMSPTENSIFNTTTQTISMELTDTGGSQLNMSTVVFKVNGTNVSSSISWSGDPSHQTASYVAQNLMDGINTVELSVTDNDGNVSNTALVRFIVSRSNISLVITKPREGAYTNVNSIEVAGTTSTPNPSNPVSQVTVNGESLLLQEGAFSTTVDLVDGENTIVIIATDSEGKTAAVVRKVVLDTAAPIITDVVAESVVVDAGGRIRITFKVIELSSGGS